MKAAEQLNGSDTLATMKTLRDDPRPAIREAALAVLVNLQDLPTIRTVLSSADEKITARVRNDIANRMLASTGGAVLLRQLIEDNKLSEPLKKYVIGKAVRHPDANVRAIYEQYVPTSQRAKRLGETVSAAEILALPGDAQRGAAIFTQSSAAQCNKCHSVNGAGDTLGPDLIRIGKKYERAALLETILDPSKAIAPEYVSYVLVTNDGRGFVGFLVEKTDREIVLKDAQKQIIRVPRDNVESLTAQSKSVMPELVLREISAQDAADLLAYLVTLQ
jgi:putative heme-binding domain-containing protein